MQDHPKLREMLESRREALEACGHWRSIDTAEARERLVEFEELVAELDREIDEAIQGLSPSTESQTPGQGREGS